MAKETIGRRSTERWVDCNAARAAYGQVATDPRQLKILRQSLGSASLARIRGREGDNWVSTRRMRKNSISLFAEICSVAETTLLANGSGLHPLEGVHGSVSQAHRAETEAEFLFADCASSYNLMVKQKSPIRLIDVDRHQLRMLVEQYVLPDCSELGISDKLPRTALRQIATLLPALARHGAVITDRTKATRLYDPTTIFERTRACKLIFPPSCLAKLPGLDGMTVWVSEANTSELEHFGPEEPVVASGCYLYLVQPQYHYKVHQAPGLVSGRTALRWLLTNGSRKDGLRSPELPCPEDIRFDKLDPLAALLDLGAILGPKREIISLYWPIVPSDDQMFTLRDGRRCRTYDLIGYPIFIAEP